MFQKTFCLVSPTIPSNNPIPYWCYCWIQNRDWLVNGILKIRMWQRSFALVYHIIAGSSVYYLWANQGSDLSRKQRRVIERESVTSSSSNFACFSCDSFSSQNNQGLKSQWSLCHNSQNPTSFIFDSLVRTLTSIVEFFFLSAIWPPITTLSCSWFAPLLSY